MEENQIVYFTKRAEWRMWLVENFEIKDEVWFVFPNKSSGKPSLSYNDAVEEALCFGWIDSIVRTLDNDRRIQRFSPRKSKGNYSQLNIERLRWLLENELIHPKLMDELSIIAQKEFEFPPDILEIIKNDDIVWENFQTFSESYKRIRIAWIDGVRNHPDEFKKRLDNFIKKTRVGKKITAYGGSEKYY